MLPDDATAKLMRAFCEDGDAVAFRKLVARFLPLVLGAALRRSGGNAALAEDVAQIVFADFARRMPRLRADDRIGAWLYRAAFLRTGDILKSERRRKIREQQAAAMREIDQLPESEGWQALSPALDDALARLRPGDREVLVLRYLDGLKLEALARAQRISPAAAQKRVERALERLRSKLGKAGIKGSALVLAGLIATRGTGEAAPAMVERIASRALEGLAGSGAGAATALISLPIAASGLLGVLVVGTLVAPGDAARWGKAGADRDLVSETGKAAPPAITARVPAAPESLEGIIDALGKLLAHPLTSLDRLRAAALTARIPEAQAKEALALMDAKWTRVMLERVDEFGTRRELCYFWGNQEPAATLDWLLAMLSPGSKSTFGWRSFWNSSWTGTLAVWAQEDWPSAWAWTEARLRDGSLKADANVQLMEGVAQTFGPGMIDQLGLRAGLEAILAIAEISGDSTVLRGIGAVSGKFESDADFRHLMEVVDLRVVAPEDRVRLKSRIVQDRGRQDWVGTLAWVRDLPDDRQRARFGWSLGFPGADLPPGFNATAHADWLYGLRPRIEHNAKFDLLPSLVRNWFFREPEAAGDWLLAHNEYLDGALAWPMFDTFRRINVDGEGAPEAWRAEALRVLRAVAAKEERTVRSYTTDSFSGSFEDLPEVQEQVEAFVNEADGTEPE